MVISFFLKSVHTHTYVLEELRQIFSHSVQPKTATAAVTSLEIFFNLKRRIVNIIVPLSLEFINTENRRIDPLIYTTIVRM